MTRLAKAMSAFTPGRSGSADGRDAVALAGRGASLRAAGSGAPALALPRRAPALLLGLFAAALFALAAALPSSASAAEYTQGPTLCSATGSGAGECQEMKGIAVDQSNGMVYVADPGNRRVNQFEPDGTFVRAFGWNVRADTPAEETQVCTTATGCKQGVAAATAQPGQVGPASRGIAVDPDTHIVYVASAAPRVNLFDGTTGEYIADLTGDGATADPEAPERFAATTGLAIDTSDPEQHYLWVAINVASRTKTLIDKFEVAGPNGTPKPAYVCQITGTPTSISASECPDEPSKNGEFDEVKIGGGVNTQDQTGGNLAVNPTNGDVYVAEWLNNASRVVSGFDAGGNFLNQQFRAIKLGTEPETEEFPKMEAVAASSDGNVFVAARGPVCTVTCASVPGLEGGNRIQEYDPDSPGTPVSDFGFGVIGGSMGIAINETGAGGATPGTVYVAEKSGGDKRIWTFAPAVERELTVTVDGDGDGSVISDPEGIDCDKSTSPCSEDFLEGPITLEADPDDPGSVFTGWSGPDVGSCDTDPECVVTLDADKEITATFDVAQHTLTIGITGEGSGDVLCKVEGGTEEACEPTYAHGTEVELVPAPDTGSGFGGWSGDCAGMGACELTMDAPKSVTATFTPVGSHSLTITQAGNGDGTIACEVDGGEPEPCASSYPDGTDLAIVATPDTDTSSFAGFSAGTGSATVCSTTSPCEFELTADSSVTATFTLEQRTLTITKAGTGDGSFACKLNGGTAGTCAASYPHGSNVELIATAAASSSFTGWSNGGGSAASCSGTGTCAFQITADSSVTGTFTLEQRTLTVTKAGNGTGTLECDTGSGFGPCAASYADGTEVTIQATPDAATSTFTGWSAGSGSAAPCTGTTGTCEFTITANSSVTGTISLAKRQLTVSKAGTGTGTVTSAPSGISCGSGIACEAGFDHGTTVALSASPGANSHDVVWTAGCDGVNAENKCIVEMEEAKEVTATFSLASFALNAATAGTGTGAITSSPAGIVCGAVCAASFEHGTTVTLAATPAAGSTFAGWTGACTGMGACHVTITQARGVTAHFDLAFVPPLETCETNPALCPIIPGPTYRQCVKAANRAFANARKAANRAFARAKRRSATRARGKVRTRSVRQAKGQRNRALQRAKKQRARSIASCKRRFGR